MASRSGSSGIEARDAAARSDRSAWRVAPDRLIGRAQELDALDRTLETSRLTTLRGPGGSGKTRLAQELARRVAARFAGGVAWVDLASVEEAGDAATGIAAALGVRDAPGGSLEAVASVLSAAPVLLVLDNCEHVVDSVARCAAHLLTTCEPLRILATSREPLAVPGEVAWPVPPLAVPPETVGAQARDLAAYDSVRLFLERAREAQPSFALSDGNADAVARICRQLDGLPLAIELAAARVTLLSPHQIADRLDRALQLLTSGPRTAADRHRTLRSTIEWSVRLLDEREALLFERLAVFADGFTIEGVEQVCAAAPLDAGAVLELFASLVSRSLVAMEDRGGTARYRLLETVRQFALERLRADGAERELRDRHAAYYERLALAAERRLSVADDRAIASLQGELANLAAAANWCFGADGDAARGIRLVAALSWFWYYTARWTEGAAWLAKALAQPAAQEQPLAHAVLLRAAGGIDAWFGHYDAGRARLAEAERIARALGDPRELALSLGNRAALEAEACASTDAAGSAVAAAALEQASRMADEALACARQAGRHDTAYVLTNVVAFVASRRGDDGAADAALAEAEAIWRELDDPRGTTIALTGRARLAALMNDMPRAERLARQALARRGTMPDEWFAARALRVLAYAALARDDDEQAVTLLAASARLLAAIGAQPSQRESAELQHALTHARSALGDRGFDAAWRAGHSLTLEELVERFAADERGNPEHPAAADRGADLRVEALGPLRIFRRGAPLPPESWTSARPRELLLFLLCHPEGATRERIGVALWPEASAAQVRNNVHTTLHRLRSALGGGDWIVFAGDRYRLDPELRCELDAHEFEAGVAAAVAQERARRLDADALEAVLATYRGPFLDGEVVGDWHLEYRDRLARLHRDGLRLLGRHALGGGDAARAARAFVRLVAADDLDEDAYRWLMRCHAALGDLAEARRVYRRLEEVLARELDDSPSDETTRLLAELEQPARPLPS